MSYLEEETDEYLILRDYAHGSRESYSTWEIGEDKKPKYSQIVQDAEHYALYEIKIRYRIDKKTGKLTYLTFEG